MSQPGKSQPHDDDARPSVPAGGTTEPGDRPEAETGAAPGLLSADEVIDIVDEHDRVVGQARREEAYARGLPHRCTFVLVRDARDRIFVHRRTDRKLVFPSMYDMFVGGVLGTGETYDEAALREAEEELGVSGLPQPEPLFRFYYTDGDRRRWWSAVYQVRCDLPVHPQVEEVAWHAFLTERELTARLTEWPWVPDGLEGYRRLLAWRADGGAQDGGTQNGGAQDAG